MIPLGHHNIGARLPAKDVPAKLLPEDLREDLRP